MLKRKFLNVGGIGLVFLFRVNVLRFFHQEEAGLSSHEGRSQHRPAQVTRGWPRTRDHLSVSVFPPLSDDSRTRREREMLEILSEEIMA